MMTSAQVVETSVTITDNSPSQDYTHLDDQITLLNDIKIKFTSHLQRPKNRFLFYLTKLKSNLVHRASQNSHVEALLIEKSKAEESPY